MVTSLLIYPVWPTLSLNEDPPVEQHFLEARGKGQTPFQTRLSSLSYVDKFNLQPALRCRLHSSRTENSPGMVFSCRQAQNAGEGSLEHWLPAFMLSVSCCHALMACGTSAGGQCSGKGQGGQVKASPEPGAAFTAVKKVAELPLRI